VSPRAEEEPQGTPRSVLTSLALGWLAMTPLLLAYEWAQLANGGAVRNTGERLMLLAFDPLGEEVRWVRWTLIAGGCVAAAALTRARGARVRPGVARVILEGLGLSVALGPLLVVTLALLSAWLPRLDVSWQPAGPPPLDSAALLAGGAAWEELCFRVGGYGILYLLVHAGLGVVGVGERAAAWLAEAAGLVGSSLVFAAAHLRGFVGWLGRGGAEFEPALFTWLVLAGILLGLVFRLRGPGVAAWTHGLFNVALLVGVDPDVLT